LDELKHSAIHNYVAPGLTSWLIGTSPKGIIRMFEAERDTREQFVTPHNHDSDFTCLVLDGQVDNYIYHDKDRVPNRLVSGPLSPFEKYARRGIRRSGDTHGAYETDRSQAAVYEFCIEECCYRPGETYSLQHDEYHSIRFHKGTRVLFFEGPKLDTPVSFLEPWVAGYGPVPTFKVEPWMFVRIL